jgi:tRNA pseudouridine55 synthase
VTARFGTATDTGDATGTEIERHDGLALTIEALQPAISRLLGRIRQVPPMYSALKHEGKRLYELAREGKEVPRKAREVEIFELAIDSFEWPDLTFVVHCSKGTYVRSLVSDLARSLGTVAHVAALRRLCVEPFAESQMVSFDQLESAATQGLASLDRLLLTADAALVDRPAVRVSEAESEALRQGRRVALADAESVGSVRIYDPSGRFVGIGDLDGTCALKPSRIFPA